ncbi:UPF0565 protein C2orf69 homolog, partial [Aplysia californica]|uniref:UPF0565 protein C2orf69 homolog n=1 Tax=Aplysia californica TaxID=6500 RepID=A0ABM1A0H6_APLCA
MTKDRILFSTSSSRVMAQAVDGSSASISRRLSGVKGDAGKVNDVYVHGQVKDCKRHVIFFGGDVQDYPENMEKHRDNRRYKEWSTEATAAKVLGKFPQSLVFVVKPSRMHLLTFAVYSNFVETSDFGNPSHSCDFGAVKHLSGLYSSAVGEVYDAEGADGPSDDTPVSVVGFSKGCVVLNQIVFELPSVEKDSCLQRFLSKITEFHWLDGGHSGGPDNT